MPRIQPLQLMECLEVLLTPSGGIKGDEVERISSLMEKYSKMMVSKAVYLLILKETESSLLDRFMGFGGWNLIKNWLSYALNDFNWPLLKEILEVLAICPVNVERLKSNELPRLIKFLSKGSDVPIAVRDLATNIVQNWLAFVKAATKSEENNSQTSSVSDNNVSINNISIESADKRKTNEEEDNCVLNEPTSSECKSKKKNKIAASYKSDEDSVNIIKKPARQLKTESRQTRSQKLLNKLDTKTNDKLPPSDLSTDNSKILRINKIDKASLPLKRKSSISESDIPKTRSSITKEKNNSDKVVSKLEKLDVSTERKNKSPVHKVVKGDISKSKSNPKIENKKLVLSRKKSFEINEESSLKLKININSKLDNISDTNKSENKKLELLSKKSESGDENSKLRISEKGLDKVLDSNESIDSDKSKIKDKIIAKSLEIKKPNEFLHDTNKSKDDDKIGAKKIDAVSKKAVSISIEKRFLNNEEKPKTVKTYNSKFRLTGLEDAASLPPKPPVKRPIPFSDKKKIIPELNEKKKIITPLSPSLTLPSSSPSSTSPPSFLSVSNTENNNEKSELACVKSAYPVIKSKKVLQECGSFIDAMISAAQVPKDQIRKRKKLQKDNSTDEIKDKLNESELSNNTTPKLRFYKDTLETSSSDEDGKKYAAQENKNEMDDISNKPESDNYNRPTGILKGSRKHGKRYIKKNLRWKEDKELEAIQYFEVDASERSNVSKTFCDMKIKERCDEREALFKARKQMDDYSSWLPLIPIDLEPTNRIPGASSVEKELQYLREKSVPEIVYFNKNMIPDSPCEPDPESYTHTDPIVIPAEDVADTVCDFGDFKWPDPKMNDPELETSSVSTTPITSNMQSIYNQFLGNTQTFTQNPALATIPFGPNPGPVTGVPLPANYPTVSLPTIGMPTQIMPICTTIPTVPNIPPHMINLSGSNHPAQFVHPAFVNPTVFVSGLTPPPSTTSVPPTNSQNQNWGQATTGTANDQPENSNQSINGKEWNSKSENKKNNSENYQGYSNGPSWNHSDNTSNIRRGRGAFHDRGRFNHRGMYNRGTSERGGHKNPVDHGSNYVDYEHKLNDRPYSREQNWKNPLGNNWRGPTPPNTRLCRNIKQKGFCAVNGCRFFHP